MLSKALTAVHFGAGNIGRGFIGPLLSQSGYHVIFVDVQEPIIQALNSSDAYHVHILDGDCQKAEVVNFSGLRSSDPQVIEAIATSDLVTTSVGPNILRRIAGTIAEGLSLRRKRGGFDINVIACENMVGNTDALKEHVIGYLKEKGEVSRRDDLAFVGRSVGFANCEVDRIVPPFKGDSPLEVGVEGFFEWIVETKNLKGSLNVRGMQQEYDLSPFFERKLYTLNCGHAILAYLGHVKGYKTTDVAIRDKEIQRITLSAIRESGEALIKKHGFDRAEHESYIRKTMTRYANPNIKDDLVRVARNPLRKLSPEDRLLGPVNMCISYGLPRQNLLKGIAAAFYFDAREDDEAVQLQSLIQGNGVDHAVENTTGLSKGCQEHGLVMKEYQRLSDWRYPGNVTIMSNL